MKWTCRGFKPVVANTKSEARARFKEQLRELESLRFLPGKVRRLPPGTVVEKAKEETDVRA